MQRPVVAEVIAGAAPRFHDVAGLVEYEDRRRRHTALGARRIERGGFFVVGHRAWPLEHPDIVLRIDGDAADLAKDPVVGQWPRPIRVNPECRALGIGREEAKMRVVSAAIKKVHRGFIMISSLVVRLVVDDAAAAFTRKIVVCSLSPGSQLMIVRPKWCARAHWASRLFIFTAYDAKVPATVPGISSPTDRLMLQLERAPGLTIGHSFKVELRTKRGSRWR